MVKIREIGKQEYLCLYFKKALPPPDKPEENSDSVFRNQE
jgi:hypothetical protein